MSRYDNEIDPSHKLFFGQSVGFLDPPPDLVPDNGIPDFFTDRDAKTVSTKPILPYIQHQGLICAGSSLFINVRKILSGS